MSQGIPRMLDKADDVRWKMLETDCFLIRYEESTDLSSYGQILIVQ